MSHHRRLPWKVNVETANNAMAMADRNINRTFPAAADANDRIKLANEWFREGHYGYTANPNVDIFLRLGPARFKDAALILVKLHKTFTFPDRAAMLACPRPLWKEFPATPLRPQCARLGINKVLLHEATARAVNMLETRFRHGPSRPFKHKTAAELVHIISANTYENCNYDYLDYSVPRKTHDYAGC
ncbi:hypothetical protein MAPG_10008 [Magnaporthiopsis poae ATCC 64411]|uniref:Uncharacterized protein n=1 Tax=Magnaporthiopsis poae (strain ATCC 64411 / 73-15) TaxID=644358 RepID=A0A0C4EBG1_MAGP6|nr:hypothetical protein MAPG_10008 [Magnaporthiopsis poae ATCC 64411]